MVSIMPPTLTSSTDTFLCVIMTCKSHAFAPLLCKLDGTLLPCCSFHWCKLLLRHLPYFFCPIFLLQWLNFPARNTPNFNLKILISYILSDLNKGRQTWGTPKDSTAQRQSKQEKNTKHYFWQPLRASPSVTLITIQLWEEGYSVQHSGTQPGSCSAAGRARAPPLSQVRAFWPPLCSPTYATLHCIKKCHFTVICVHNFHYQRHNLRRMTSALFQFHFNSIILSRSATFNSFKMLFTLSEFSLLLFCCSKTYFT